ncbi:peptidoglycan recognition protein 1-like [Ambystoma mexicanum]|uniref:peptidoglycan recognition protein 1-like n=1 Tax=Ambystoma mexicanum TaxID=8296 RepID=UPI0037E7C5E7
MAMKGLAKRTERKEDLRRDIDTLKLHSLIGILAGTCSDNIEAAKFRVASLAFVGAFKVSELVPDNKEGGGCPKIISRSAWGAHATKCSTPLATPVANVIIHHSAGPACNNRVKCTTIVKGIQRYHMDTNKWCDIGYSFVVGEDGSVFEGRGWKKIGTHAPPFNSKSIGICVLGTFTSRAPSAAAQNAVKSLIKCGISKGFIRHNYDLRGHRNVGQTSCPGNSFYKIITKWAHFKP